jgi:hypothetical protein
MIISLIKAFGLHYFPCLSFQPPAATTGTASAGPTSAIALNTLPAASTVLLAIRKTAASGLSAWTRAAVQVLLFCPCGQDLPVIAGLCRLCYRSLANSRFRFGGLRDEILARISHRGSSKKPLFLA